MQFPTFLMALLLAASPALAQRTALNEKESPFKPSELKLPKGKGAWAVRVIRTGGFSGTSFVDITVSSLGNVRCAFGLASERHCPEDLPPDASQAITQLASSKLQKNESILSGPCPDCPVTRITLQYRDDRGKVRKYFAYWNDVSAARAPNELVQLATTVLALRR